LTQSNAPSLKREDLTSNLVNETEGEYSDPDDGVEIVDIDDVKRMDWMAPETLRREKDGRKKKRLTVKKEGSRDAVKAEPIDPELGGGDDQVNLANALDLSESEDEEELENIFGDFAQDADMDLDGVRQEKLYFFQFPEPFPKFTLPVTTDKGKGVEKGGHAEDTSKTSDKPDKGKKVTFAPDVKAPSAASTPSTIEPDKDPLKDAPPPLPHGLIGRLEIYKSGAVKMRLENGNLLDVTAATQPSFLQHAVHIDVQNKKLCVLGEVNRRFVVSPNMDALIEQLELADQGPDIGEGLITMDTI